ncbi:putative B3 domain-containing protein At4g03170 [Apium graveolens]|uniref:putative B3 domain-containing protein At4g03170 n=1 Tax=Apium graveolens TaxID=4045 RepID=UPI003D7BBB52
MNSEEEAAALVLCSMKNSKVDYETALELEKTRLVILKKRNFQHPSSPSLSNHHTRLLSLVPPSLAEVIGNCSTPFDKRLTGSDTQEDQVRLLLKYGHVMQFLHPLLRPSEIDKIKKRGMVVCVYDRYGRMYEMVFRLWGTKAYVITTRNWFEFCIDHGLEKVLDWVTIWMFRHNVTGRICFVITSERRCFAKAIEPVFDLPVVARKKRTKSCSSSSSNLKRRRLNDDDRVISVD